MCKEENIIITNEEAILIAKALAKSYARILELENTLKDVHSTKDQYLNYWLEECEKTKKLEDENSRMLIDFDNWEKSKEGGRK
jgi:hypothetical protein